MFAFLGFTIRWSPQAFGFFAAVLVLFGGFVVVVIVFFFFSYGLISYPGRFSRHCFGDEGTHRKAYRGDYAGSFRDEESSFSSSGVSGEVLFLADANRVLTWLRPVGESKADAF